MKIDELLEKFEELREHEYQKGNTEGAAAYSHCRQLLETTRTALEAGMRGTLKFRAGMPINKQGIWYLCAEAEGQCAITNQIETHPVIDSRYSFFSKQDCEALAKLLGMNAEFMEPTDEK